MKQETEEQWKASKDFKELAQEARKHAHAEWVCVRDLGTEDIPHRPWKERVLTEKVKLLTLLPGLAVFGVLSTLDDEGYKIISPEGVPVANIREHLENTFPECKIKLPARTVGFPVGRG